MANESTRVTLIKCMRKLVRERSFSQISADVVCDMAHVSRRTFYRYFPDKYALLEATYQECYFSKLEIADDDSFWDLFYKMCDQIYSEPAFFTHAFDVKGQNGFWEEAKKALLPYMRRDVPVTPDIQPMVDFYLINDIDVLLQFIEMWIRDGFKWTPAQFAKYIHDSFKVHGKWVYEVATGKPRTEFKQIKLDTGEW